MPTKASQDYTVAKIGVGIEFSVEAIVEIIRQRFPNFLDWDNLPGGPYMDVSINAGMVGFYWTGFSSEDRKSDIPWPLRSIQEGCPIPIMRFTTHQMLVDGTDDVARCGIYEQREPNKWAQCIKERNHEDRHAT